MKIKKEEFILNCRNYLKIYVTEYQKELIENLPKEQKEFFSDSKVYSDKSLSDGLFIFALVSDVIKLLTS